MAATIGITIAFGSSDRLAGAYGTAVSTTMLLTTGLLFVAMAKVWRWPIAAAVLVAGGFFVVDFGYFSANLLKIADGGWLPLTIGALIFLIMLTWRSGLDAVRTSLANASEPCDHFIRDLKARKIARVPGTAVFLTRSHYTIPPLMIDYVNHMGALHRAVIVLTIAFEETPRVPEEERGTVEPIGDGLWGVTIRFGFIEIPDLCAALKQVKGLDPSIDLDSAVYFATRDLVTPAAGRSMLGRWRLPIFAFLYLNAVKVVDRFNLPAARVVEIARQIEV
jgi:KUP system potassium uptake protein